jgi:hypothetical protein
MSKVKFADYISATLPTNAERKPLLQIGDGNRLANMQDLQAAAEKAVMSPLQASRDARTSPFLRQAIRIAARCGFEIDETSERKVSLVALDA